MPPSNYVPKLVQVPAEPGPLVPYTAAASTRSLGAARRPGSSDAFPVGALDLVLLFVGAAVLVWGLAVDAPAFVLVVASVVTIVGFLLPLRKLALRRSHPVPRPAAALDGPPAAGEEPVLLLDLADPTSNRLAGAYRRLLATVAGRDDLVALEAAGAAHAAVGEAAALVDGRPPVSLADLDQLDQRSEAMERLATLLATRPVEALALPPIAPADDGLARLQALVTAFA
jgi:hypothetical protein